MTRLSIPLPTYSTKSVASYFGLFAVQKEESLTKSLLHLDSLESGFCLKQRQYIVYVPLFHSVPNLSTRFPHLSVLLLPSLFRCYYFPFPLFHFLSFFSLSLSQREGHSSETNTPSTSLSLASYRDQDSGLGGSCSRASATPQIRSPRAGGGAASAGSSGHQGTTFHS